jgi:1-hydroxycarotenoid 3,4-desaturase
VICNADCAALATGALGAAVTKAVPRAKRKRRSLSAMTWALSAKTKGFPLTRHNVFFSGNYRAEFDDISRFGWLSTEPTVYVCAQDRGQPGVQPDGQAERLLVLVNAPPSGDRRAFNTMEIEECARRTFGQLQRCGLMVDRRAEATMVAAPADFEALFPATGGALYGQAVHGPMAAFRRPGSRSAMPGLYLAGGSVHPGPGVPMAVLSGRMAATSALQDLTSKQRRHTVATSGGTSMHSATTAPVASP